jgi:glycosyltransferase involved in cell wall biosynthesis
MVDLTFVVTTHDRPVWLETCLQSILATAATVDVKSRVLVIDDFSSVFGENMLVCERARVDYVRLGKNRGYSAARVAALEHVDSRYLAFIDDDDVLLPRWMKLHLDLIEQGHDVVSGSYWETDSELRQTKKVVLGQATFEGLKSGYVPINDGSLIRVSALKGIPWRPDRDKVMMMSMWLAFAAKGKSFAAIEEPVWLHRLHGSNMSSNLDEQDARFRAEAIAEWT